ncbi:MAG: ice-binding family protein [Sphaerochaeta sp.]|nr:ice-binding family protein [Sphaerochaeta sp.]
MYLGTISIRNKVKPPSLSVIIPFGLVDATGYATSSLVTGKVYAADMAAPTPIKLTTAIGNMETAYTDAAGRPTPKELNLGSGAIGGMTLKSGLYKWDSAVNIGSDLTLNGGATDIWVFQISGDLNLANNFEVLLTGGALPENVFWQVAGIATLGTGSHMEGIILSKTQIILMTSSSINGRLLAQTQVTLDAATVVDPELVL